LYLIFARKYIVKSEYAKAFPENLNTEMVPKGQMSKGSYIAYCVVLGIILIAAWIATLYQSFTQIWFPTEAEHPFMVIVILLLLIIVNVPFLILTKKWYKDKHTDIPTVGTTGRGTIFILGFAGVGFCATFAIIHHYLIGADDGIRPLVITAVVTTLFTISAALGSRWRILILEDSLVIRPRLGKTKEIAYEDIEKVQINNPPEKLETMQIIPKSRFAITFTDKDLGYDCLLQKLREKDVKFEYKFPPSITEPDLTDETTNTLNRAQES